MAGRVKEKGYFEEKMQSDGRRGGGVGTDSAAVNMFITYTLKLFMTNLVISIRISV